MPSRPAVQEAACSPVPRAGLTTQIAGALQAKGELRGFCGFDFGNYCIGRSHRLVLLWVNGWSWHVALLTIDVNDSLSSLG